MNRIFFCCLFLFPAWLCAQNQHSLSGYVKDHETGEVLIGASIAVPELETGTYSNAYGYYSLTLPEGDSILIRVRFLGYGQVEKLVYLVKDEIINLELQPQGSQLDEVVIEANSLKDKLNSSQMSMDQLSMVDAKKLPALFGEVDIIKTLQLKPGVQSGGEGSSGIYVRGGGPDQNLVLLDEAQVYNPSHLFGFFSTFNSDAVKDVKLFKGGYPAEYGGKLSSVIDVRLNEGNKKKFSAAGGLGLIASRLTLEGPIVKDKASFMVAGRRTYFDVFTRAINKLKEDDPNFNKIPDYYFYDFNAKINYNLGEKDQLFLSGYFGRDKFGFKRENFKINFNWGNSSATARWTHIFNPKLFLKTAGTYSQYDYSIQNQFAELDFNLGSGIRDFNGFSELLWLPDNRHTVKLGATYTYQTFKIARFEASSKDSTIDWQSGKDYYGNQMAIYLSEDFRINSRWTLNGGLRYSGFLSDDKFYHGIEPRTALKFSLSEKVAIKSSFTRMYQYVHMVSNSGASLPTDIWYPSNSTVKPQRSDQVALGASLLLGEDFILTNEYYCKWLKNQVDFRDGAQIFFNPELDEEFVFGRGWGYGTEIYLEKTRNKEKGAWGRLSGWLGYTLSWSWREFDKINSGSRFHPQYDRRHDVSIVLIMEMSKRLSLTGTWVYGTGQAISLPVGRFAQQNITLWNDPNIIPEYLARNSFRMPSYHRMDLGLVYTMFPKWGESDLTLSIYNVYNRRNAYFIYYDTEEDSDGNPVRFVPKQVSLFPIIPSLSWNFKF